MDVTLSCALWCFGGGYEPSSEGCCWTDWDNWDLFCQDNMWYICYGTAMGYCVWGGVDNVNNCPPEGVYPLLETYGPIGAACEDVTYLYVGNGRN